MPKVDLFKTAEEEVIFDPVRYNQDQTDVENAINEHDDSIIEINTKADNAVTTANTANTNSSNAVNTANTANTNATNAVNTANNADSNATTALNTANEAKDTADAVQADYNTIKPQLEAAVEAVADKADVSYVDQVASDFERGVTPAGTYAPYTDNTLTTTSKEVVGAINELDSDIGTLAESVGTKAEQTDLNTTNTNVTNLSNTVTANLDDLAISQIYNVRW